MKFLKQSVDNSTADKIIVVTHHVPSLLVSSPDFEGSRINEAFVSKQAEYIADSRIDYWIYDHSHRNIDAEIGGTKYVSNQLGYTFTDEHHTFDRAKVIY